MEAQAFNAIATSTTIIKRKNSKSFKINYSNQDMSRKETASTTASPAATTNAADATTNKRENTKKKWKKNKRAKLI